MTTMTSLFTVLQSRSARCWTAFVVPALLCALMAVAPPRAEAQELWAHQTVAPYAIIIDTSTGDVLMAKDADTPVPTASLSKLMTALLAFEALESGVVALDETYDVSDAAFRAGQQVVEDDSLMWLNLGDAPTMDDLLRGLIIQSGNDAAIAIAEAISGSEALFVRRMNAKAEALGLTNSSFANASGIDHPEHYMSMRDLAILAQHMIDEYPQYFFYYSEADFTWAGITQPSRNPLLGTYNGADGMKTGFTESAQYGIVGTAIRGDRRIIVVLGGMSSIQQRAREVRRALDWAFSRFEVITLASAGDVVGAAEVWLGADETAALALREDIVMATPKEAFAEDIRATIRYEGPVAAPIAAGQEIGVLEIAIIGQEPREFALVAVEAVEEGGYFVRISAAGAWALSQALSPGGSAGDAEADQ